MWFKPYYGIEAERVGRDRGLCASAILSPEVSNLDHHMYLVKFSDGATTFVFPDEVDVG